MFLSCDWGTSRFRLRLAERETGNVLAEFASDEGVAAIARKATRGRARLFREVLGGGVVALRRESKLSLDGLPILVSGMASSTIGWRSLPYGSLPFPLDGAGVVREEVPEEESLFGRRVFLISGIRAERDVLRGEETQLLGLARLPAAREILSGPGAIAVFPGTHSKHVEVRGGAAVGFRTFMTGDLFEALSTASVLRHSTDGASSLPAPLEGEARAGFEEGVRDARALPLAAALFRVRAAGVLEERGPARSAGHLSGLLVGSEAVALLDAAPPDLPVVLAAGPALAGAYLRAFEVLGARGRVHPSFPRTRTG